MIGPSDYLQALYQKVTTCLQTRGRGLYLQILKGKTGRILTRMPPKIRTLKFEVVEEDMWEERSSTMVEIQRLDWGQASECRHVTQNVEK